MPKPCWREDSVAIVYIQWKSYAGWFLTWFSFSLSQMRCTWSIQQQNGGGAGLRKIFRNGDNRWMIRNRYRPGVLFCNALFIHQRQVYVGRTYWGLSCNSSSTSGEGEWWGGGGVVDRRTPKFQFLNTRQHGIVWSQSFSEEIGCSFSVLRPPSPKP